MDRLDVREYFAPIVEELEPVSTTKYNLFPTLNLIYVRKTQVIINTGRKKYFKHFKVGQSLSIGQFPNLSQILFDLNPTFSLILFSRKMLIPK